MAHLRYLMVLALVVLAAVVGILWQDDDTPTISFTRPANTDITWPLNASDAPEIVPEIVPRTESLNQTAAQTQSTAPNESGFRVEEPLSEQQLAEQIKLARRKLAQVEALNARKQAQVERIIAEESSAEQSLIEAELAYRIGGWRHAWRTGDTQRYFEHYSDSFKPSNGKTLEQWRAQRVKRLNPSTPIDLNLEDFEVTFDPITNRSLITFKQFYKSGNYQDTIMKRLIMANEQGQWMIVSETTQ